MNWRGEAYVLGPACPAATNSFRWACQKSAPCLRSSYPSDWAWHTKFSRKGWISLMGALSHKTFAKAFRFLCFRSLVIRACFVNSTSLQMHGCPKFFSTGVDNDSPAGHYHHYTLNVVWHLYLDPTNKTDIAVCLVKH
jgi:hypothetical protein